MTPPEILIFREQLLKWFSKNKRELPWRTKPNWYKIYLSEIILQQTTVSQGLPYFKKFIKKFPDIKSLATADEQEVLHTWAGLGYYSRARNMLKTAKILHSKYGGSFPEDYSEAIKLPGVGPYSAAAILSIHFNKAHAVMDGNVIRVVARLFAIKKDTRDPETLRRIKQKTDILLDLKSPGIFNEAFMELGALVCTPQNPNCNKCPVNSACQAYSTGQLSKIPFKSPAIKKHRKFQIAALLMYNSKIGIVRRAGQGLLAGMWELPNVEVSATEFENGYLEAVKSKFLSGGVLMTESEKFVHTYSHIHLTYKVIVIKVENDSLILNNYSDIQWVNLKSIKSYAIHNAHKKILLWHKNPIIKN